MGRIGRVSLALLIALTWGLEAVADPMGEAQREALAATGKVSDSLLVRMPATGRIRVLISFHAPTMANPADPEVAAARRAAMEGRAEAILANLSRDQMVVGRRYQSLALIAGELDRAGLERLSRDPMVRWIEPDLGGRGALAESVPLTNTNQVQSLGLTGQGVRIAVIDTGIDTDHPDLSAALDEERCFCSRNGGCCPNAGNTQSGSGSAEDDNGHGTHVTGIIASSGAVAPIGASPGVEIVAIKALDGANLFFSADVLAALDWINTQSTTENFVDVVNLSLATDFLYGRPCNPGGELQTSVPWTNAVTNLTSKGILVVAAAGNTATGIAAPAPACVEESFSVAASYDATLGQRTWLWPPFGPSDICTDFTPNPDGWMCSSNAFDNQTTSAKTDLVAPGSEITSSGLGGVTGTISGTSQAAPHVAGCAALVLEANASDPTRTLADLEADLRNSPTSIVSTGASFGSSFPRLDCATAVPEPGAAAQSLALLLALALFARRASPSRQEAR